MSQSTDVAELTQPKCGFPTIQLRAYRKNLVNEIIALERKGQLPDSLRRIYAQTLLSIDRLALDHGDILGCKCWFEAQAQVAQVA